MYRLFILFVSIICSHYAITAQQITGNWKGTIGNSPFAKKVALKLVLKGDSIVGTSYYYTSKNNYKRYSVRGYFNANTNAVIWYDDVLIASKQPKLKIVEQGEVSYYSEANFNCPGGGVMMLDGVVKQTEKDKTSALHLTKTNETIFDDEWNVVIDNWLVGGNSRVLIDSVQQIAYSQPELEKSVPIATEKIPEVVLELPVKRAVAQTVATQTPMEFLNLNKPNKKDTLSVHNYNNNQLELDTGFHYNPGTIGVTISNFKNDSSKVELPIVKAVAVKPIAIAIADTTAKVANSKPLVLEKPTLNMVQIEKPKPIEKLYTTRQKLLLQTIPIEADSIILHFYDNAQVDGDSIALFINDTLLQQHILLTDKPYIIVLHKEQLLATMELTMVAENLGSIPPNTSYMVAFVGAKRYEATLSSTEQSSAVIQFVMPQKKEPLKKAAL